jgi:Spy/CpxP family protein refolding chaperone
MNRIGLGVVAAAIALACVAQANAASSKADAASSKGTDAAASKSNAGGDPASIQRMIAWKEKLGLSEEQSAQLRTIRVELREKNQPLQQQVDQVLGPRPKPDEVRAMSKSEKKKLAEQRKAAWQQHPELKPVGEQIRANRQAAKERALAVLTPEQRQILEKEKKNVSKGKSAKVPEAYEVSEDPNDD